MREIIVAVELFTPRKRTDWFLMVTPRSINWPIASSVMAVISFGWLNCVCSAGLPSQLAAFVDDPCQGVAPRQVGQHLLRHYSRTLCRKTDPPNVFHVEQPLANRGYLRRLKLIDIAAETTMSSSSGLNSIYENAQFQRRIRMQLNFVDGLGVITDAVTTRAKAAIYRTGVSARNRALSAYR